MDARELYRAGKLTEAVAAMNEEVRKHPADANRRGFLAELLCLSGNLDRADIHLDTLVDGDPQAAPHIAAVRQVVRAERARQQCFAEGRVPEFIGEPTEVLKLHLRAMVELQDGDAAAATKTLEEAEEKRVRVSGVCDGKGFEDLRDLDDLTASFFEVLTTTGKYFWVPIERMVRMEFHEPERPRDLMWRRATVEVSQGPDGEVFVPVVYAGSEGDEALMGRSTDWVGGEGSPVRGVGQRTLLFGEDARSIMEIKEISFEDASPA